MPVAQEIVTTLISSVVIPFGLFITLLIVRAISHLWYVGLNRRPLPVVVNDISLRFDALAAENSNADQPRRPERLLAVPGLLRDYVAADPPLSRQLAPGVAVAVSPDILSAAPGTMQSGWSGALLTLVLPQKQAAYNIFVTPHRDAGSQFSAHVQVVKTPQQWIVASHTFAARTLTELVLLAGGFCMESVQLQPGFLRRTPRWEQWGSRGGYSFFRQAVRCQDSGDIAAAQQNYELASRMAPGNITLGVHRASMYEFQGRYSQAAMLYDALHGLWQKNIEVTYRAAAVRVDLVQDLLKDHGLTFIGGGANPSASGPAEPQNDKSGESEIITLAEALRLLAEAEHMFVVTADDLRFRRLVLKWLSTRLPRQRDIGERRYWMSWLRRDNSGQPLGLLRRSKRREYLKTVQVAREANKLLRFVIQTQIRSRSASGQVSAQAGTDTFDIDASVRSVLALIKKKRAGWLAHWEAACYFSRAAMAADLASPRNWRKIERQWRRNGSLGFPAAAESQSANWRACCEGIAIGEIGRVLRNPCNQLSPELLQTDPDMRRLHFALGNEMVRALIGSMPDHGPPMGEEPVRIHEPASGPVPASGQEPVRGHVPVQGM